MPPLLALLLCSGFVAWLLRLTRRQAGPVTAASWIPTIWVLSIATKPLGVWFGGGDINAAADGSANDRLFQVALLILGCIILSRRRLPWHLIVREHCWLFVLLSYMLASIVWSDIPFVSLKRWIRELVALIMALLLLSERYPREAAELIIRRSVLILIPFSILLIKYYPHLGVEFGRWSGERMWIGVTTQKNGLGRLCLIAAFYLVWSLVRTWRDRKSGIDKRKTYGDLLVLILTLYMLKGPENSYPATAIAALLAAVLLYLGLLMLRRMRINIASPVFPAIILFFIAFGTVTPFVGGASVGVFTGAMGRDETLTGRTDVWASLLPVVKSRPVLGAGFGGFWSPSTREKHMISEAHCGYLEVLLGLGSVGLMLITAFYVSCSRKAHRVLRKDYDWGCLFIGYLLISVIHNVTESSINSFTYHLTAVVLLVSVTAAVPWVGAASGAVKPRRVSNLGNRMGRIRKSPVNDSRVNALPVLRHVAC
jgi:exopolysaccharide production protein ExoQ